MFWLLLLANDVRVGMTREQTLSALHGQAVQKGPDDRFLADEVWVAGAIRITFCGPTINEIEQRLPGDVASFSAAMSDEIQARGNPEMNYNQWVAYVRARWRPTPSSYIDLSLEDAGQGQIVKRVEWAATRCSPADEATLAL